MIVPRAYEDFVNFIVAGVKPEAVLAYNPTPAASDRVEELVFKSKTDGLSAAEKTELDHYLHVEHITRLAKARARQQLKAWAILS